MSKMTSTFLAVIFLLALILRFLYFPGNVNFAYDQARDSFAALDLLKGDLKIIGPPTTISDKIFHGVTFYYFLAPIYFFTNGNIEVAAGVLRIINALGVFLVFAVASNIFNKQAGFLTAFLYAISYEQSQYSLFFGHPSLGVISVLVFYLGLSLLIFKNNPKGLIIALVGLGLTIQAEAVNGFLTLVLAAYVLFYKREFLKTTLKFKTLAVLIFLITVGNYILIEVKYNFRTTGAIISILTNSNSGSYSYSIWFLAAKRFIHDNFFANEIFAAFSLLGLILIVFAFIRDKNLRSKIKFLIIWFLGGLTPYLLASSFSYYYSPGASVSLLVLISFLIYQLFLRNKVLAAVLALVIVWSNLLLILTQNQKGPNPDIVIQSGMVLGNQKQVLDFIYLKASKDEFAVNALTVPLNVNTTWSYLFEWYGQGRYGYLPVWGGEAAAGFAGNLKVETKRSSLPAKRFLIIEPPVGIEAYRVESVIKEENYFSKIIDEKKFGTIIVQEREVI